MESFLHFEILFVKPLNKNVAQPWKEPFCHTFQPSKQATEHSEFEY